MNSNIMLFFVLMFNIQLYRSYPEYKRDGCVVCVFMVDPSIVMPTYLQCWDVMNPILSHIVSLKLKSFKEYDYRCDCVNNIAHYSSMYLPHGEPSSNS